MLLSACRAAHDADAPLAMGQAASLSMASFVAMPELTLNPRYVAARSRVDLYHFTKIDK